MKVLSLFDGISVGKLALDNLGIPVTEYVAYEIDDRAKRISRSNHGDSIKYFGDVQDCNGDDYKDFDLLIGGSPCQNLSAAMANREGLSGQKSKLFFEYLRIKEEMSPQYFFFENVGGMPKEDRDIITDLFGVEPIKINSKLVAPAMRNRLYWTNIPNVTIPEEREGCDLQDILVSGYTDRKKARALLASDSRPLKSKDKMMRRYYTAGFTTIVFDDPTFTEESCRYLYQIELERCMGLPDGYTGTETRNHAAHHIGNAWTVPVIEHIFQGLKRPQDYRSDCCDERFIEGTDLCSHCLEHCSY